MSDRVGYVLKRYPRLSETFILNEILAHEAAGLEVEIFSLRSAEPGPQHDDVRRVKARVTYLSEEPVQLRAFARAMHDAEEFLDPGERTFTFRDAKRPWSLWLAGQVAQAVRERGITHLHAHFATEATATARLAAAQSGVRYTFTAHAKDIFHESVDHARLCRMARDAAGLVTVSDFNVNHLGRVLGEEACPIHRVYNGLDLASFPLCERPREAGLILGVGRLVEKKGFDDLLRACAQMKNAGRKFRCLIVGEGEEADTLRALRESLGLAGHVELLGALPREEVVALMTAASVFAAPCVVGDDGNRDGLPTVLLEAMALGTPCVSTPVTGIPEVVRDEETGLLVPERAPQALASALGRMLDNRALAAGMAGAARKLIETSFDLTQNTVQIRELFRASAAVGVA